MARTKYYAIEPELMTEAQEVCSEGRFGLYRNILKLLGPLSFHQLAGAILQYKEHNREGMVSEEELGFSLLRLYEEGLIGIDGVGACKDLCCTNGGLNGV